MHDIRVYQRAMCCIHLTLIIKSMPRKNRLPQNMQKISFLKYTDTNKCINWMFRIPNEKLFDIVHRKILKLKTKKKDLIMCCKQN